MPTSKPSNETPHYVAIDLGSNSFHMMVARYRDGGLEKIDRVKEMVQIGRGIKPNGNLNKEAQERALQCLQRFAERTSTVPAAQVRAVGTKALRMAKNSDTFLAKAEAALGHPIQVISGYEEARLIYLGISHDISRGEQQRLVIDIGGGSTEFIIGRGHQPELLESLSLGCVSYAKRFFPDDKITEKGMRRAHLAAREEVEQIREEYLKKGWEIAIGASGTIRALADLMPDKGGSGIITLDCLLSLRNEVLRKSDELLAEVSPQRRTVLPAGLSILIGIFQELKLTHLQAADGTLKEGLIYDTIGRNQSSDARNKTVSKLTDRYNTDKHQADHVFSAAKTFLSSVETEIKTITPKGIDAAQLLRWGCQLHEIGLSISHSGFHRHGHYLLRNMDMAGFSRLEQRLLATLIGLHRRKWHPAFLDDLPPNYRDIAQVLGVILRLAAVLCRSRNPNLNELPAIHLKNKEFQLYFPKGWLEEHPLSEQSLQRECEYLQEQDYKFTISTKD